MCFDKKKLHIIEWRIVKKLHEICNKNIIAKDENPSLEWIV